MCDVFAQELVWEPKDRLHLLRVVRQFFGEPNRTYGVEDTNTPVAISVGKVRTRYNAVENLLH